MVRPSQPSAGHSEVRFACTSLVNLVPRWQHSSIPPADVPLWPSAASPLRMYNRSVEYQHIYYEVVDDMLSFFCSSWVQEWAATSMHFSPGTSHQDQAVGAAASS